MSFLLFDLNHTSKQRVHITEVTLQARILLEKSNKSYQFKVTRPSFSFGGGGGGYHPTLKLSGIPTFTFIVSLTHRMDNI